MCARAKDMNINKIKVKASGYQFSGKYAETKIERKYKHNEGERIVNNKSRGPAMYACVIICRVQDGLRMVVVRG